MELELLGGSFVWATSFIPHNDTRKKEEEREKKRYRRKLSGPRYTIHPLCGGNCFLLSKGAKGNFNLAILPWNAMRFHFSLHSQPIQRLLFDYSTKKQKKKQKTKNKTTFQFTLCWTNKLSRSVTLCISKCFRNRLSSLSRGFVVENRKRKHKEIRPTRNAREWREENRIIPRGATTKWSCLPGTRKTAEGRARKWSMRGETRVMRNDSNLNDNHPLYERREGIKWTRRRGKRAARVSFPENISYDTKELSYSQDFVI